MDLSNFEMVRVNGKGLTAWAGTPLPNYPPHQRGDISALDKFNVHRCPTRRVFCGGTGLRAEDMPTMIHYDNLVPRPALESSPKALK
ncbi:hypothetical protein TNCV_4479371 [Trichonephila clavipes]|nr:hypothetical protein TNCV_4479371 [Trichonephila clavipes]